MPLATTLPATSNYTAAAVLWAAVILRSRSALNLALLEMRAGIVRSALVGCVEIATDPLEVHRRRLGLAPDAVVGEASHWLWLEARAEDKALGAVNAAEVFANLADLRSWFVSQAMDAARTAFASGQFLGEDSTALIQRELGLSEVFNYRAGRGYYDCQSGALVGEFLRGKGNGDAAVLHVNAAPDGRLAVILAKG